VKGLRETINTSSIHMDVLGDYRRVVGLMANHVYGLLRDSDKYNILPRREE
jgi:Na+/phosphate symporter